MTPQPDTPEPYYIAYIDEAGDSGLKKVRPIDPGGSSEWLVLGAVVIRAEHEPETVEWVRSIRQKIRSNQGPDMHFRTLSDARKKDVCEQVAGLKLKSFAMLSNKKNMKGYRNPAADAYPGPRDWFYNFCVRLLIERVSDYCERMSVHNFGSPRKVKLIFSQRGGVKYLWLNAYQQVLQNQSRENRLFLHKRDVKWQVLDHRLVDVVPHRLSAGAQLADAVTSAYYSAADALGPRWNTEPAKLLKPCMATERGRYADYSVALQPTPPRRADLTPEQQEIFRFYGYVF